MLRATVVVARPRPRGPGGDSLADEPGLARLLDGLLEGRQLLPCRGKVLGKLRGVRVVVGDAGLSCRQGGRQLIGVTGQAAELVKEVGRASRLVGKATLQRLHGDGRGRQRRRGLRPRGRDTDRSETEEQRGRDGDDRQEATAGCRHRAHRVPSGRVVKGGRPWREAQYRYAPAATIASPLAT